MTGSVGRSQVSKSKTEKAEVRRNKTGETDTSRVASAKSGSSRENARVKADDTVRANSETRISVGVKAQTGVKANATIGSKAVLVDFAADPTNYVSCELSWSEFNYRVLSRPRGRGIPLSERLKSLSITTSNLNEFYVARAASLKDMVHAEYTKPDIAGLTPQRQLDRINKRTHELVGMQYPTCNRPLMPTLRQNGLRMITEHEDMTEEEAAYTGEYFKKNIHPILTPMVFDSSRPFPLVRNKALNIATSLRKKSGEDEELEFIMMQVPSVISGIVELPREIDEDGKERRVVILPEEIIERNMPLSFLNYDIVTSHPLHITRNADPTIDEEEAVDLLGEIQKQFKKRQWGEAIRLEIEDNVDKCLLKTIRRELSVNSQGAFEINGPLDLMFLTKAYGLEGFEFFKAPRCMSQPVSALMNEDDMFANTREGDIPLHHPYQSLDPVMSFVHSATWDQSVLTIKQTLYRASRNSSVVAALAEAADNGKQVSVLVEPKVRFDEENSVNWAKILEKTEYHVTYGLVGLGTHSKITLVVWMEEDGIRRYVHLSTGNYNDSIAKLYTDCGILTCNPQIGEDVTAVSNILSGYPEPLAWNKLSMAPLWLRGRSLRIVRRKAGHAREGRFVHIMARVSSLCDREITTALYEASCAGVKVETIIRGICCLKTDVPRLNENISVRSIVKSSLGHSRISYLLNDVSSEIYMGSAGWMPRNLDHRVETMFPAEDEALGRKVIHILKVELEDNVKTYVLQPDGSYEKENKREKILVNSQGQFCREAILMVKEPVDQEDPARGKVLKSVMSSNQGCSGKRCFGRSIQGRVV